RRKGFFSLLMRWLGASPGCEVRAQRGDERYEVQQSEPVPIVIKDFDRLPAMSKEHTLGEGEVFGEIAALTRTPRTASVVPDSDEVRLLEIRWQGLRALVGEDEAFQRYVEERYRDSSRRSYVFRTGLFAGVGDTDPIRARLSGGDVRGLFFDELGWYRPRERSGWPSEFRIPSAAPSPLAYRLRLWLEGDESYLDLDPKQGTYRLGAAEKAEIKLPLRPRVSAEHAELSYEDGRWFLRNRSRYGTVVDGERVRDRIVLFPGAKVRIGEGCWLLFQAADLDAQATGGEGELALRLLAESPVHNGIGGIKAYLCELGQRALPDQATCEAALGHLQRREYLARETSRHVLVFKNAAGETDWRWRVPIADARPSEARERSGLRLGKDVTPLVTNLIQPLALEEVIKATDFVSYGKFRWFERGPEEELEGTHWSQRTQNQPVIANQGHYPNGVIMIRAGFARLTRESDQGERTVSYLRPEAPYGYGLEEVIENYLLKQGEDPGAGSAPMTLPYTLRAIGYADTVFFPSPVLERFVLPTYRPQDLQELVAGRGERVASNGLNGLETVPEEVPSDLREFLVQHHLINGTQAMVINLDRCTRCDDCVRGCSSTHQRDPRFVRHGLVHGNLMVANACMHCVDPVCLIDCPTGAIHRPLGGGLVLINDDTCIGCTACAHNCPYDNIRMVPIRNGNEDLVTARVINEDGQEEVGPPLLRATKCDLCHDQATGETSCVRACPHDALKRVDLSQMGSLVDLVRWLE
ncbi:MAG TPA: hypothetical protein DEA08_33725, partial [Planctomycetes bacterium]|nr:hypothetical protein [Planctomycetota bacterium]